MGTLHERLKRIKDNFVKQAPAEARAVMERSTEELRASGILSRLPKVGSLLPAFELEDSEGKLIRSHELIQNGPLVMTFYRGVW